MRPQHGGNLRLTWRAERYPILAQRYARQGEDQIAMSIKGKANIVGVFEHPTRKADDKSLFQLHAECARGALADAGLSKGDIDGYFCASGDTPGLGALSMIDYLGLKLKHVIEPSVVYRYVTGVNDFSKILRFDERDILSNTNEVEYRVINRLYAKKNAPQSGNCNTPALPSLNPPSGSPPGPPSWEHDGEPQVTRGDSQEPSRDTCPGAPSTARELISWELAQKYFLDTSFGGALVSGQRNVFTTTVDLTAFAFLTNPRHLSPLVSRLRIQPSSNVDAEWDLDYDFTAGRINASTTSLTYHIGQFGFSGIGLYANFPGQILATNNVIGPSRFNQFRTQVQYGHSDKRGFSGAASFGVDAQFALVQYDFVESTYNWDCCGITVEYRRIRLGTIRNENEYRFNYTLANIGSFGNLLRKERLY